MNLIKKIFRSSPSSASEMKDFLESYGALRPGEWNGDEKSALTISAVWACVRILSSSVTLLPLHLYRKTSTGRELITSHPALSVLKRPNEWWTSIDMMQWLMTSVLLPGNGYARIYRDFNFRPTAVSPLLSDNVTPFVDADGHLWYKLSNTGEFLHSYDVIHLKGLGTDPIVGLSPIRQHRENLRLAHDVQAYGLNFFENGGNTEGYFTIPGALKEESHKRLKADINARMAGLKNAHAPWLLEGGMDYHRINIPLEDAQFLQTRKYQKTEVATIFGVPPHMIADLERSTNNNIEHQGMEYVTYSLMPWLVKLENEFNRKLLYDSEDELYFKFNTNALLRGDANSRANFYKTMYLIGAMNANEIRELEDMNPYAGGENYFAQANMNMLTDAGPVSAIKDTDNGKTQE